MWQMPNDGEWTHLCLSILLGPKCSSIFLFLFWIRVFPACYFSYPHIYCAGCFNCLFSVNSALVVFFFFYIYWAKWLFTFYVKKAYWMLPFCLNWKLGENFPDVKSLLLPLRDLSAYCCTLALALALALALGGHKILVEWYE